MSNSCDPMDCRPPGSSVHGIFQAEYWSGLPFPSPGDLSNPGIEAMPLTSALAGGFFTTGKCHLGSPMVMRDDYQFIRLKRQVDRKEQSKKKAAQNHKRMKEQSISKVMTCFICKNERAVGGSWEGKLD